MEITFKYKDKIITTPNLEKKLKRMKLSLEDIEIIETPIKEKKQDSGIDDSFKDKELRIVRSTQDEIRRVVFVTGEPPLEEVFRKHIWNGKTGIKEITPEYIKTLYYEKRSS